MICEPCRKAGLLNSKANESGDPAERKRMIRNAKRWHKSCLKCDCQHRTGFFVNRELIKHDIQRGCD